MILDIKTLVIVNFAITVINTGTMAILWHQYKKRFAGLSLWLLNVTLQAAGLALIILRGAISDFLSVLLANAFLITSTVLFLIGLEYFVEKKGRQIHNFILLAVFIGFIIYYSLFDPNLVMRKILWSAMVVIVYSQSCWLLLRRVAPGLRQTTRITCVILGCYVAVSMARIILLLIFPLQTSDLFTPGIADSLAIMLYIVLGICLTISIILMVSGRLFSEVQAQEKKFTTAFHSSPYAIMITRLSDGKIIEVNDGFVDIFQYQYDEVIGKTMLDVRLWCRDEDLSAIVHELAKGNEAQGAEFQFRKKSGNIITGLFSASRISINNEKCILLNISDITELSQMKQRLQIMATHDALTGLPNRTFLYERFNIARENLQSKNQKLTVILLDFDNFKWINDNLGHDTGDQVLVAAAERLKGFLRKNDTVARFGGDEFVLLFREIDHKDDVIKIIQKILQGFRQPFVIGNHQLNLNASIGIAMYPEDGNDINELIKKSDEALYFVKKNGRDNYQLYSELTRI